MADRQLLHTAHIPVRWGDMDSYGHVNNTLYFQYLEEARVAWFETLGIDLEGAAEGPVVLQSLHTYLKPVVHPATVVGNCTPAGWAPAAWYWNIACAPWKIRKAPMAKATASWSGCATRKTVRRPCRTA